MDDNALLVPHHRVRARSSSSICARDKEKVHDGMNKKTRDRMERLTKQNFASPGANRRVVNPLYEKVGRRATLQRSISTNFYGVSF